MHLAFEKVERSAHFVFSNEPAPNKGKAGRAWFTKKTTWITKKTAHTHRCNKSEKKASTSTRRGNKPKHKMNALGFSKS